MFSTLKCNATIAAVRRVRIVHPPEVRVGPNWRGLPHAELLEGVFEALKPTGTSDHRYFLSRGTRGGAPGAEVAAAFRVWTHLAVRLPKGVSPWMALTANNDGRRAPRFYCGAVEEETDTPVVVACVPGPRHDGEFDLAAVCGEAVREWERALALVRPTYEGLSALPVPQAEAERRLMDAGRAALLPWSRIGKVDAYYRGSSVQTGLGLLRAFCTQLALSPPDEQLLNGLRFLKSLMVRPEARTQTGVA